MKFKISHDDHRNLYYAIEKSLSEALKNPSQSEPQLIANMVWHIPRQINGFTLCKNGLNIQAGGVFVHQQPQVSCGNFPEAMPQSVEIGDLLFLRTEKRNGTVSSRSALLLQAKKISSLPASPDNKNQHHLYAKWPPFEYVRSTSALNGKKRYLTGPDLYNAGKYLLIGKNSCCCLDWPFCHRFFHLLDHHCVLTAQPSYPEISQYRCFLVELTDFILGEAGKAYHSPAPKRTRNWDRVIHDLTFMTGIKASEYIRRASQRTSPSRGQCLSFLSGNFKVPDSLLCLMGLSGQTENNLGSPPEVPPEYFRGDSSDGDGGVSVIEFIVSTDESGKEA